MWVYGGDKFFNNLYDMCYQSREERGVGGKTNPNQMPWVLLKLGCPLQKILNFFFWHFQIHRHWHVKPNVTISFVDLKKLLDFHQWTTYKKYILKYITPAVMFIPLVYNLVHISGKVILCFFYV